MTSRDYTKEVGVSSPKKTLSRPIAYVVLAVVAVGVTFGVAGVIKETKAHHATEKAATGSAIPSTATAPAEAPAAEPAPAK